MARTGLKKAAVVAVIGGLLLGTGGTALAAPFHHFYHRVYRHDDPVAGLVAGAAIGTIFGIIAAAAASNNGYYEYGPSYPPPGYYAPGPYDYGYER